MENSMDIKQKKRITIILIGLLIFSAVMWILNGPLPGEEESTTVTLKAFGSEVMVMDKAYIKALDSETFTSVIRSSGKKPEEAEYTGVAMAALLESAGVDVSGAAKVIVRGSDGYATALTMAEINESKSVYLTYELNGGDMKGKSAGGNGPYQLVIRKDPFSQRWCKYVNQVEVQ